MQPVSAGFASAGHGPPLAGFAPSAGRPSCLSLLACSESAGPSRRPCQFTAANEAAWADPRLPAVPRAAEFGSAEPGT